ncbi:metal ABC transporter permease [Caldicellulosiruptor changbaiensis]|uniref:Metal ABC transporter permease n=1 Tax=Caldicellulosiruptor changbaiensis TaxID=1222016 RepID=A0A3T0D440_9FIRM|nr:metal ABC transporter permease [Caldicellulosiruptor changbaiensis]AZT89736.1 metal ABC transporter permease [Caldicellulosiruptor changbaiensis]
MLQYEFMQRAFLAGVLVSIMTSLAGNFLVLKRFSQMGDSLSHTAIVGVAAALLLNFSPTIGAIISTVGFAIVLEYFKSRFKRFEEVSLALVSITALGLASVLFGILKSSSNLMSFLFGSIVAIGNEDVWIIFAVCLLTVTFIAMFRKRLILATFDEVSAKVSGINTKLLDYLLSIVSATIIAVSLKIVGGLLISSMIVFPTAIAMRFSKNFGMLQVVSLLVSLIAIIAGLTSSYYIDIPPGGATVLTFLVIFFIAEIINITRKKHIKKTSK